MAVDPQRLAREFVLVRREAGDAFGTVKGDLKHYFGFILGEGDYKGGVFPIELKITDTFPYDPPIFILWAKIWHPNVKSKDPPLITHFLPKTNEYGQWDVCLNVISKDWRPAHSLVKVIKEFKVIFFTNPRPEHALDRAPAEQMVNDPIGFKRTAQEWVRLYATWDNYRAVRSKICGD